jgi:beta-N-acetylhexosaminidase
MAGQQFFTAATYTEFTKQQYPGNRRAAGFDRPTASGGGTCDVLASQQSFGHSGFTGTLAWADPKNKVIFIFLSNRVHPNQENWKLRDLNIRTDLQHVVYQALAKRGR